jgi:hypothetical protein
MILLSLQKEGKVVMGETRIRDKVYEFTRSWENLIIEIIYRFYYKFIANMVGNRNNVLLIGNGSSSQEQLDISNWDRKRSRCSRQAR